MDYAQVLARLTGASRLGAVPGLKTMARLMEKLNRPQEKCPFVHIAGTNGKGSTAAYIAAMLQAAGWKTGLFTSPYIQDFRERIQVNGRCMDKAALCRLGERVLAAGAEAAAEGFQAPTAFELVTALGLLYFAEVGCEIAVLEVGLGGRLDATNIIPSPEAVVLTRIGLDHTELLGGDLGQIAGEKAGIIKAGSPVISGAQVPEVTAVFAAAAAEKGCAFYQAPPAKLLEMGPEGLCFDWGGTKGLKTAMTGLHQLENAALALQSAEILDKKGWRLGEEARRRGLLAARCPGRLELLKKSPLFFVDGAHNPQGLAALAESLRTLFPGRKLRFLVGVLADKAHRAGLEKLLDLAAAFYTTAPPSPRAMGAEALAEELRGMSPAPVRAFQSPEAAVAAMLADCGPGEICCACGSLYQVGAIRRCFEKYF